MSSFAADCKIMKNLMTKFLCSRYVSVARSLYAMTFLAFIFGSYSLWVHSNTTRWIKSQQMVIAKPTPELAKIAGDSVKNNPFSRLLNNSLGYNERVQSPSASKMTGQTEADSSASRIVIVEERQEVIKYWFEAANAGTIPKEAMTLLYIGSPLDGTMDPLLDSAYRLLFPWPHSSDNINYTIQENTTFHFVFDLTKLFKRIIWVYPTWALHQQVSSTGYDAFTIHVGLGFRYDDVSKAKVRDICVCAVIHSRERPQCVIRSPKLHDKDYKFRTLSDVINDHGHIINKSECNIKHITLVEVISEDLAITKMWTADWFHSNESVILGVDENLYGITSVWLQLMESGLTINDTDLIDNYVSEIICIIRNASLEQKADVFITNIVNRVILFIDCQGCDRWGAVKRGIELYIDDVIKVNQNVFCNTSNPEYVKRIVVTFATHLAKYSLRKLRSITNIGFCFMNTQDRDSFGFRVAMCHGNPTRNKIAMLTHSPTENEIKMRSKVIRGILDGDHVQRPAMVTISRSVREGSTPRGYATIIEKDVLDIVYNMLGDKSASLVYDQNLLWGIHGVGRRYEELILKNKS